MQTKAQAKEEPESPTKGGRKKKGDEQEEEVWKWWVLDVVDSGFVSGLLCVVVNNNCNYLEVMLCG